jgi:hypothetical protein
MHIKDAKFSDHSVVPSGEGDGKVREILYELAHNGDDSEIFLSLEPHLGVFAGLAKLEKGSSDASKPKSGLDLYKIALDALNKIIATL